MKTKLERLDYDDGGWGEFEKLKGKSHGWSRVYFPDGRLKWERSHENGREHGISRTWNRRGRLLKEVTYQDGVVHGHWKEWNSKGRLIRNLSFAFGERTSNGARRRAVGHQNLLLERFRRRTSAQAAGLRDRALRELKLPVALPIQRKRSRDRLRVSSWLGLVTHSPLGKAWPSASGEAMVPLLQIRIDELPIVPPGLRGIAFLAVFAPADYPIHDGQDELVIWTAKTLRALTRIDAPEGALRDQPRSLSWRLDAEYPDPNDLPSGLKAHLEDHEPRSPICRRAARVKTRVGGWPGWIQSSELRSHGEIILQFDSADLSNWMPSGSPSFYVIRDKRRGTFYTRSECS